MPAPVFIVKSAEALSGSVQLGPVLGSKSLLLTEHVLSVYMSVQTYLCVQNVKCLANNLAS